MEAQIIVDVCEVFTSHPSQNKLVKNPSLHDHGFSTFQKSALLLCTLRDGNVFSQINLEWFTESRIKGYQLKGKTIVHETDLRHCYNITYLSEATIVRKPARI